MAGYKKIYKKKAVKKPTYRKKRVYKKKITTSIVKRVISRMAEKKRGTIQVNSSLTSYNSGITPILPMTPYTTNGIIITQGTGQGDRIGNQIRLTSVVMKYVIFPAPYNATTNLIPQPMNVILYWFKSKVNSTVLLTSLPNFFQNGDSATTPQSNLFDQLYDLNTDQYTLIAKRVYKLGYASDTGTGNQAAAQSFANNDYKYNIIGKINLTKYCPKIVRYNDSSNNPTTPLVQCFAEIVPANGQTFATSIIPATIFTEVDIRYTDI